MKVEVAVLAVPNSPYGLCGRTKQQRTAPRPRTFRLDRRWIADSEWRPAAGCTRENLSLWMMTA